MIARLTLLLATVLGFLGGFLMGSRAAQLLADDIAPSDDGSAGTRRVARRARKHGAKGPAASGAHPSARRKRTKPRRGRSLNNPDE